MTTAACETPVGIAVSDYLADRDVRRRIVEYCGGSASRPPTAAYVAALELNGPHLPAWDRVERQPPARIAKIFNGSGDIARSLWDAEDLLFFLDIDYANADAPADPFLHPADMLLRIEPVYSAARSVFARLKLGVRAFVTGRGYHFIGQVPLADPVIDTLADIVPATPPWHAGVEARRPKDVTAPLSPRHAKAADGMGCLVEYAAHLILDAARGTRPPVVLNGTLVGHTGPAGRECVSIDFSYAGDPLDVRHARAGFSPYQWHRARRDLFGAGAAAIEPLASVPRGRGSVFTLMERRSLAGARAAAARGSARIPNVRAGVERLRSAYARSSLAAFHREYFTELSADRAQRPSPAGLPPCVAASFARPNDLLLKPEHIQHAVRWLMSRDWRPAAIARLLEAEYAHDHGWGDRWTARMHPRTRAEFEVRVFAGLLRTGRDALIDFNCVSAQEKWICPRTACRADLRADAQRLAAAV